MSDLFEKIAAQLRHFTHEEIVVLVRDFLAGLDEKQQVRFLNLVAQGPRPLVAKAMGLGQAEDLLDEIKALRDAIAGDECVEYDAGYAPEYGECRGFGDDSWTDEMDDLFAAATSFFRASQFKAAADAYVALFDIFHLSERGYHFTRHDLAGALRTDLDVVKKNMSTSVGQSCPDPAEDAIAVSDDLHYYSDKPYALLDAREGREGMMRALEAALTRRAHRPASQKLGFSTPLNCCASSTAATAPCPITKLCTGRSTRSRAGHTRIWSITTGSGRTESKC
jgi:hypothetical protein